MIPADSDQKREVFFKLIFGTSEGYVCIAALKPGEKKLREFWFRYPTELQAILDKVAILVPGNNVYFCSQMFKTHHRTKDQVDSCPNLWADLDYCDPDKMLVTPSVALETSPGRFQALWVLDAPIPPEDGEEYSRRIAYYHEEEGADRSGWDLTQLLRIPFTYNYKYDISTNETPHVKIIKANTNRYRLGDFDEYPQAAGYEALDVPMPSLEELRNLDDADTLMEKYSRKLPGQVWVLYQTRPEGSWSEPLWQLQLLCLEAGLSRIETFVVAKGAACNKYARDNRPDLLLWKEVCRAAAKVEVAEQRVITADTKLPDLMTEAEVELVKNRKGFVERYVEWAQSLGDAASQYHQAGAFIALSSILAGTVRLPTSFGTIIPNLWFMILADTTLTRKSTAMDIATDLITEVDSDIVLATDGSIEGLMTSLSTRPGRPSLFLRDEFSGLLEAIVKKDYLAGMAESLTKLYDGRLQKRILRKETIEVRDPVLITFAGGIRSRIQELLRFDDITSGFIPRFIFITAESDVSKRQALGPPTQVNLGQRQAIVDELQRIHTHYADARNVVIKDGKILGATPKRWDAQLTPQAWDRYNEFEDVMVKSGMQAVRPDLMMPVFDRLSKSALKAAVLIAAARLQDETVVVEVEDILKAIWYANHWRGFVVEVVNAVGQSASERTLGKIMMAIERRGGVMARASIMQQYHLNSREMDLVASTLEQRGLVTLDRIGKAQALYATKKEPAHVSGV